MKENFFAYISRMRYIGRWSLMRNSLPENIQEHSHMVAVLAHALGVIRRDVFHVPCNPDEAATVALFHDSSEILTGDLPTPIKYHSDEIRDAYKEVEALACHMLLDTLPEELRGAYEPLLAGETALGLHQVHRGAQGRQQRVPLRGSPDPQAPGREPYAGGGLLPEALYPGLRAQPGRTGDD